MNRERMEKAVVEAKRFIETAELVRLKIERDGNKDCFYGSKETGAMRRASLDLTRALANLRQS